MLKVLEGTTAQAEVMYLDDEDHPIIPAAGYPKVRLYEGQDVLLSAIGSPSQTPGKWVVSLPVPDMGLESQKELTVVWVFRDRENSKFKEKQTLMVLPKSEQRLSDVVVLAAKERFDVVLPLPVLESDVLTYQVYQANTPLFKQELNTSDSIICADIRRLEERTNLELFNPGFEGSLYSNLLQFTIKRSTGRSSYVNFMMWVVTPQMQLGMSQLEAFLNKARLDNVIPALQYTDGDLMTYLERGLYLFNTLAMSSAFTGTNMLGPLFDGWLLCSSYYALSAQLLAEGSLAFDFSGQGISLNVDRTPQLEAALGRIESRINDTLVPLKKQLAKQGILQGDGSIGRTKMRDSSNMGRLGLTNAPTTRLPRYAGLFMGRRA